MKLAVQTSMICLDAFGKRSRQVMYWTSWRYISMMRLLNHLPLLLTKSEFSLAINSQDTPPGLKESRSKGRTPSVVSMGSCSAFKRSLSLFLSVAAECDQSGECFSAFSKAIFKLFMISTGSTRAD